MVPSQQAIGRKVTVVDQHAPFLTKPADLGSIDQSLFSNAINHPSNPGYDKMAQVWLDAIEALSLDPGSYSRWIRGYAGVTGKTGLNDAPDGDGLKNGVENFFGTAPNATSSGIAVGTANPSQGTFTFIHPQGILAGDLAASYQWSKNLETFAKAIWNPTPTAPPLFLDSSRHFPARHHRRHGHRHRHCLLALAHPAANACIVLYSSSFGGSSGTNLNCTAVTTTGAQHTQYGTSASATWSAATNFTADGSFDHTTTSGTTQSFSGTLAFTPQNGHVYTLRMTTSVDFTPPKQVGWFATGYFENLGYTAAATSASGGANVWMLTRPGDTAPGLLDQVARYNVSAGTGPQTFDPLAEDHSGPSTLTIVLDTTGGTGDWSAQYFVGNLLAASVADLGAMTINSVGIATNLREDNSGRFQSFELSVIAEPSAAILGGLGMLALLRRRR